MANEHWHSSGTQIRWVAQQLLAGRTLNHDIAIAEIGCHRLAAVVGSLRHNYQWPIQSDYRGATNAAHYWMPKDIDLKTLRFPNSAKGLADDAAA